jgi:hypothetical protein
LSCACTTRTRWSSACRLSKRESLLETYPESFGVPPHMEAHHKVEAYPDQAQPGAVFLAIDLAWEMQRR